MADNFDLKKFIIESKLKIKVPIKEMARPAKETYKLNSDFPQIKDRNNRKKVFGEYLILNGDLHHYPNGPRGGKPHVYPGWLTNQDSFKIKKGMFLYLAGYLSIFGEGEIQLGDPFSHGKFKGTRILTDNTINGEDWVEKGIYG